MQELNWSELFDYREDTGEVALVVRKKGKPKYMRGSLNRYGYLKIGVYGKTVAVHRIAMSIILGRTLRQDETVDHINGDKTDNRACNLRLATNAENNWNRVSSRNVSGYKGVSWCKSARSWRARIMANGTVVHLGSFDCKHEAAHVYNKAAIQYHGEFAVLNPVGN